MRKATDMWVFEADPKRLRFDLNMLIAASSFQVTVLDLIIPGSPSIETLEVLTTSRYWAINIISMAGLVSNLKGLLIQVTIGINQY